jgi:hypothetical protein
MAQQENDDLPREMQAREYGMKKLEKGGTLQLHVRWEEQLPVLRGDATTTSEIPAERSRQAHPMAVVLFFFSAVGCTMGWTAVLSSFVYYSHVLGMNSYLYLNFAVFIPLFPITIAQARWDSYFDRRYKSLRSFSFRGIVGFAVSAATIALVPLASHNLVALCVLTALMGTASAVLQGILKQMASFVYPKCSRLPAAVTCGMQASAALVLAVSLATGFGSTGKPQGLDNFYISIMVLVGICWISFHVLVSRCRDVFESMLRRDLSIGGVREPLLQNSQPDPEAIESPVDVEMDYKALWHTSWPCCVSIMVTVASSMSVASWFNRVKSSDPLNQALPQVLFYTRLLADLFARPGTLLVKPSSAQCVLALSMFRLLFVPLFFVYTSVDYIPRSDFFLTCGVAVFAFSSGYIVTCCYQLAPSMLTTEQQNSTAKQVGLMNVCFSGSLLCGLMASFALSGIGIS